MKRVSVALAAVLLVAGLGVAQQQDHRKASCLVGPNVLVTRQRDGYSDELMLATDPADSHKLLGGGILFRTTHPQGGQETRGYYSRDGGHNWSTLIYPEAVSNFSGDPQVAYGRTGTGYFLYGGGPTEQWEMYFYRSEDGGLTWGKPVRFPFLDHEQIAVDDTVGRFASSVYVSGLRDKPHDKPEDSHISVFRSTDDGRSWIGPVDVANNRDFPGRRLQAMNIAVFADGELLVPFVDFPADMQTTVDAGRYHYWFATSKDGGATFSPPQKLFTTERVEIKGPYNLFPFFALDSSGSIFRDRLYMVWMDRDCTFGSCVDRRPGPHAARMLFSYSSDRGKTWSSPRIVSDDFPGIGDQFGPQSIAVNSDGTVGVSWYDARKAPAGNDGVEVNRYFSASLDGGETFLPAVRVSSAATIVIPSIGYAPAYKPYFEAEGISIVPSTSHGEYQGLAADTEGIFHVFWSDGRTGVPEIWTAQVQVERADRRPPPRPELVTTDVTDRVEVLMQPIHELPGTGTVELPVYLKNKSDEPIFAPLAVEVVEFSPEGALLNASNGKSGVGATMDYSRALGDFESLPRGAISEAIAWRFKAPAQYSDYPSFRLKVTARVEQNKHTTQIRNPD